MKKKNVNLFLKKSDSKECKTAVTLPLTILKTQLSVASSKAEAVE